MWRSSNCRGQDQAPGCRQFRIVRTLSAVQVDHLAMDEINGFEGPSQGCMAAGAQ